MATQGSNSGTGPGPNMATLLNPDRRPQRLFRKTQDFLQPVRLNILLLATGDSTIDSWPQGEVHDYRPEAINDNWSLFEIEPVGPAQAGELATDDEMVPSDLICGPFYDE
ncbi:hypothetical protein BJ166DRAFT_504619 [Pestalotiopsis sp. NC0098]|nr:hypothetical protein BJ166DRAFT_504619 [Pestalotiopsis sp. NC0098]